MLNLNKNKRIKGIAVVLALVTVLALCLTGCKDQQARDDAAAAKEAAAAAVTKAALTEEINKALADYVKSADAVTAESVQTAITTALADYAKKSEITAGVDENAVKSLIETALKDYQKTANALTEAQVKAIADKAAADVSKTVADQAKLLNDKVDGAVSKIDGAINKAEWNKTTDKVVEECIKVDAKERELTAVKANYTDANWQKVLDIFYGAKIRLYRATDIASLEEITKKINDDLADIPTVLTEGEEVQKLIAAINFPVTTNDEEAIKAAKTAFDKWVADYKLDATDFDLIIKKGVEVGMLDYAVAKNAALQAERKDVNDMIIKFFQEELKAVAVTTTVKDSAGKETTTTTYPLDIANTAENLAKAKGDAALKLVVAGHDAKLDPIEGAYRAFVGTEAKIDEAVLKTLPGKTAAELKTLDVQYKNNGVTKAGDDDVVFYFSAVDLYLDKCYEKKFDTLKAKTDAQIADKFAKLNEALDTAAGVVAPNHHEYYQVITNVGKAFYEGMEASLAWKYLGSELKDGEYALGFYLKEKELDAYEGATRKEKFTAAENHLDLCLNAIIDPSKQQFNGFLALLDELSTKLADTTLTAEEKTAYVAKVTDVEAIKDVIRNAYDAMDPAVSADDQTFNEYKYWAMNQVAKAAGAYVETATVARQKEVGNNLLAAYLQAIASMKFADYDYVAETTAKSLEKIENHFKNIVATFNTDVIGKIPAGEDVVALVEFETTELNKVAKNIKDANK